MNALITGLTLLLTIFVAMAVGIYAGYGFVCGILRLMAGRSEAASLHQVFVATQAHGGD